MYSTCTRHVLTRLTSSSHHMSKYFGIIKIMPYRRPPMTAVRRRRGPVRRRRAAAKKYRNPFKRSIIRLPTAFPPKIITKMRYADTTRLDPVIGNPASYIFSANNIWDPNVSGVGHQPYGRDEFGGLYNYYRVLKSRIVATFIPSVSGAAGASVCGVSLQPGTTTISTFDTIRETKSARYKVCAGDSNRVTVTNGFNSKKMFASNMGNLNALVTDSPGEQAYYHVFVTNALFNGDLSPVDVVITIEYTVMFWELKSLPQS